MKTYMLTRHPRCNYNPASDEMLEDFILSHIPIRDVALFRKLRAVPYREVATALRQLFRDGCITFDGHTFVAGDGKKHEGYVVGLGGIW